MARGNVGNLLQHFLAIHAAEQLVGTHGPGVAPSICYVDPFAMGPWEELQGRRSEGFVGIVRNFSAVPDDTFVKTLLGAWAKHYEHVPGGMPRHPLDREYPNTAVLLKERFPEVAWDMRLCEVDPRRRDELRAWSSHQSPGTYRVGGLWQESDVLGPIAEATPVLVMLDPFQFSATDARNAGKIGYLTASESRRLLSDTLQILRRPEVESAAPAMIVLLSYADTDPDEVDRRVRALLDPDRWHIDRVKSGPYQGRQGRSFHQGWICRSRPDRPDGARIQDLWNTWRSSFRRAEATRKQRLFPDLTFYVQGRADGGWRSGVDIPERELFQHFENEPTFDQSDPRLIWFVDVRCQGPGVPRTGEAASRWFAGHSQAFREGIALVASELDIGVDPDVYPLVREMPAFEDGVSCKVVVSVSQRRAGLEIRSRLNDLVARWDDLMSSLGVTRPATV